MYELRITSSISGLIRVGVEVDVDADADAATSVNKPARVLVLGIVTEPVFYGLESFGRESRKLRFSKRVCLSE